MTRSTSYLLESRWFDRASKIATCVLVYAFTATPGWSASDDFCTTYANKALEEFVTAKDLHCTELNYPVWSMDFNHHFSWCQRVSEADANAGDKQRTDHIDACRAAAGEATGGATAIITGVGTIDDQAAAAGSAIALDPGLGDSTPLTALDPGVGDQTPSIIIIQNLAEKASAAPSRAEMVNALMADAQTRSQLQALPNISGSPQNLASQTLGGTRVNSGVSAAGARTQIGAPPGGMAPSSGPTLPQGVDWNAGIQFSVFAPPPIYYLGGKSAPLGQITVFGAFMTNDLATQMIQKKVVFLTNPADMRLIVDLPNEDSVYLVAIGLSADKYTPAPADYQGANAPIHAIAYYPNTYNISPLTLAPLSAGKGFVAMMQVKKDPALSPNDISQRQIVLSLDGVSAGLFTFGGFTLTKL